MFENNVDFDDSLQLSTPSKNVVERSIKRVLSSSPDKSNKCLRTEPSTHLPKNVVKRKFPGPAGILPERKDYSFDLLELPHKNISNDEIPCSQMSLSCFQSSPWLKATCEYRTLLERFNIKWIKCNARLNKLHNHKAPFLVAIIQNIECSDEKDPIVNIVLKDSTGEIQGAVVYSLYEKYSDCLIAGAVIILRQFGVLMSEPNNCHLTITKNNLISIYVTKSESEEDNKVNIIKLQNVSCDDLVKNLNPLKTTNKKELQGNKNIFDDEWSIPDNFEESLVKEYEMEEERCNFKQPVVANCTQESVKTNQEDSKILQDFFEDVDVESFLEDF